MKSSLIDFYSLRTQMILSFISLVLLTAVAAGLPATWLIRSQLNRRAWAQVDQATRTASALYAAHQSEIASLATLTAQRPTLRSLLAQGDEDALTAYLGDLQASTGLDLLAVCVGDRQVAASLEEVETTHCGAGESDGFNVRLESDTPQAWLLATHAVEEGATDSYVVVGLALDRDFASQMSAETGLEHSLIVAGQPIATSFSVGVGGLLDVTSHIEVLSSNDGLERSSFRLAGQPYYAARFTLSEPDLEGEVALPVSDIAAAQRSLVWGLSGSILAVVAVASVLGALLARRLSQPLTQLADSATTLRKGDLDTSVSVDARLREVVSVAQALDGARADLRETMIHLTQERDWGDHLLESIVEGIVTLDDQHRISFFSSGAERITRLARDSVLQRPIDEVFELAEEEGPFSQHMPSPGTKHKLGVTFANGFQATLAITGARLMPTKAGEAMHALVFRDVSEEEAINRLLGHFMSDVAHEFRTPLSALAASIELLLDEAPNLSDTELHELLMSLYLGILGLQTLVDNLLESASIEARRFRVSPRRADLGKIMAEAIRTMDPLLKKYGQRLSVALPTAVPTVQADTRRIVQVLVNLLSNASRHGPDNAEIAISVEVSGAWARVTVADRGPGIPLAHRDSVFVRFVRPGTDDDRAKAGAGLGLSVVKAIVNAHGGQVGVDDRPGGGATFWFTLPLADKS